MAYISFQPSDFFNTVLYTGDSSVRSITGVGFQPDWTWIKSRSNASWNALQDSSRGSLKTLFSNETDAETTYTDSVTSFDSDGFSMGDDSEGGSINVSSRTYVAWNWLANGGTTSSNTDGSITSTVQANTTSGFSIVTYTGTGATATFGHGLGAVPKMIIIKDRDNGTKNWTCYHNKMGNDRSIFLNLTNAQTVSTDHWQYTTPTSSIVYIGDYSHINTSGNNYVAYCFAEIKGYSKFGSYTGNGNADGTFVYTGFRPAFVIIKRTDSANDWLIMDSKRLGRNIDNPELKTNEADSEQDNDRIDILSNGFKTRSSAVAVNTSGGSYIYMAFAEFPLVGSNGLAGTAR